MPQRSTGGQPSPHGVGPPFSNSPGTKVVLKATLRQIQRLLFELDQAKLPFFVTIDSGCPEFFGGQPILTSVGFGPAAAGELPPWVRKLQLL